MSIEVVPVAVAHVESFRACLDAVAREKRYLAMTEAPSLERIREFVQQNIDADSAQFVAIDGPEVVGWCDVLPAWADAVRHRGILGVGLLPRFRGQGVGRRLMAASMAKARAKGVCRIELEVRVDNERAIRLYENMGFVREAVTRQAMQFDGVFHDAVRMSLLFSEPAAR